jgi:hypothetical protein
MCITHIVVCTGMARCRGHYKWPNDPQDPVNLGLMVYIDVYEVPGWILLQAINPLRLAYGYWELTEVQIRRRFHYIRKNLGKKAGDKCAMPYAKACTLRNLDHDMAAFMGRPKPKKKARLADSGRGAPGPFDSYSLPPAHPQPAGSTSDTDDVSDMPPNVYKPTHLGPDLADSEIEDVEGDFDDRSESDELSDYRGAHHDAAPPDCSTTDAETIPDPTVDEPRASRTPMEQQDRPTPAPRLFHPNRPHPPRHYRPGKMKRKGRQRLPGAPTTNTSLTKMREEWSRVRSHVLDGFARSRVMDPEQHCTVYHLDRCTGAASYR